MKHDFTYKHDRSKGRISAFGDAIQKAKQIIYYMGTAVPPAGEEVNHHWSLEQQWDRHQLGIKLALVYLVSAFDKELGEIFNETWHRRRDMVADWLRGKTKKRSDRVLEITLDDVWKPSVRAVQVQQYVEARIYAYWQSYSPKDKVSGLTNILELADPIVPEETRSLYNAGIEERNSFVHPATTLQPTLSMGPAPQPPSQFGETSFLQIANAFWDIIEVFRVRLRDLSDRVVATNMPWFYPGFLSEKQHAVLSPYMKNSGERYISLSELFDAIEEKKKAKEKLPEAIILSLNDEVYSSFNKLTAFAASNPDMPIVIVEDYVSSPGHQAHKDCEDLAKSNRKIAWIPRLKHKSGKWDQSYDQERVFQNALKKLIRI